jgi:hypothetical protein
VIYTAKNHRTPEMTAEHAQYGRFEPLELKKKAETGTYCKANPAQPA